MATIHQPPDSDADRPLPPHPYQRLRQWCAELEFWAAVRGLPPEPWPLP